MPRPRISTNLAISADGKISSVLKVPARWTSEADHHRLVDLRKNADALLIGRGTLDIDRMTMTGPRNPLRCIVSRLGIIDPAHPIFTKPGGPIHLLITGSGPGHTSDSITVHRSSLMDFLEKLSTDYGINHLHCEGGGELIKALAALDVIDELHITLAGHTLFGGNIAPSPTGIAAEFLPASRQFEISHFEPRPELGECFLSFTRIEGS